MVEGQSSWGEHEPTHRSDVTNPLEYFFEIGLNANPDSDKPFIGLCFGEPTKANGYYLPEVINDALVEAVHSGTNNGYTHSSGTLAARTAIANKYQTPGHPIEPNNIFLSMGCSGALQNTISVLCDVGDRLLVPAPGFPLCRPICESLGVEYCKYNL